jgi:D-sedoheptulose 7-phosphate isomerase
MKAILDRAVAELTELVPTLTSFEPQMTRLGEALLAAWKQRGKALVAGNGGSAADAMHLAEELVVRFRRNRRALAAIALCDPTVVTCGGNDFGFETVFSRQVEALGNPGDVLIVFTTSGNSPNCLAAIDAAKRQGLVTAAFLGKDGGRARGRCDVEFLVPSPNTARIQEVHQVLYHALCEWVDERVEGMLEGGSPNAQRK